MTPNTGWVGTTVTMTVTSTTSPIEGAYRIMWSPTSQFTSTTSKILKEGSAAKGSYTVTESFTVPQAALGMYYIAFFLSNQTEPTGSLYTSQFNIMPRLKAEPVSVSPGATITLNGTGFPANEPVSLTFDSTFTSTNVSPNNTGSFTTKFIVPGTVSGQHNVGARSDKLVSGIAPATILVVPGVTIDPKNPQSGANVTITGRGFAANSNIVIKHNELTVTNSPSTDTTGNFSYSFSLPSDSAKSHIFTISDDDGHSITYSPTSANQATTPAPPATIIQQPPAQPSNPSSSPGSNTVIKALSKPATIEPKGQSFGILGAQPVNFVWSQISASGGVTYTLEVSDNYNFSSVNPAMSVSGLTQTNFTMVLEPGTYYWRVRATGGTSNEGEWSYSLYSFRVGAFPTWAIAAVVIVYIILLCWLIKVLINRRNRYSY